VAGVQSALAGFGAGGVAPAGSGALRGVGAAAREAQANRQQQQQQKIENQRAAQRETREEQVAQAQIAHLNAEQLHVERADRAATREQMDQLVEHGVKMAGPLRDAGVAPYAEHLTSDDIGRALQNGEFHGHKALKFKDGLTDVIDNKGNPVLDADGLPLQRPTYSIFPADATVTLDDAQAKLISENTGVHPKPGVPMSATTYYTLSTQADKNMSVKLNIEKVQSEIGKNKAEAGAEEALQGERKSKADQEALERNAAKLVAPYLGQANGDIWKAMQLMNRDPKGRAAAGIVNQAYGPGTKGGTAIDEYHEKQEEMWIKAQELELKKAEKLSFTGNPDAKSPAEFLASLKPEEKAVIDNLHSGRIAPERIGYLLTRNANILGALSLSYPDIDTSKLMGYPKLEQDFTSGKVSEELKHASAAITHLGELRALINNPASRIPGTKAYSALQDKATTVSDELSSFYRSGNSPTDVSTKQIRSDLLTPLRREAAVETQAQSAVGRLGAIAEQWRNGAPSAVYEAKMPFIDRDAQAALDSLQPGWRGRVGAAEASGRPAPGVAHDVIVNGQKVGVTRDGGKTMTPN
jgi:hypothetical protein